MDPQHRQLLMAAYHALEDAGIPLGKVRNTTAGVFIGIGAMDYSLHLVKQSDEQAASPYLGSGNSLASASGRIAYHFGLNGPCMSIDTACSSSLVAIHQAAAALRSRECTLAIAGGVNLLLSADLQQCLAEAGMLSPDGLCKTFDEKANGYVRSEGCITVILKTRADAEKDGNRIYAVVKGSAVAQDGASGGLTVPNPEAQATVIGRALEAAGLTANDIDFIEAHGTGTSLGDPVETQGIRNAFGKRTESRKIRLGSVKTNTGHLEAAAGIAGFIKAALSIYKKVLPAHLHYQVSNPHINWIGLPAEVNTVHHNFSLPGKRIFGGVSSFGFTGTVAHCIVASHEGPEKKSFQGSQKGPFVLTVSARSVASLDRLRTAYIAYLRTTKDEIADICFTAANCRTLFELQLLAKGATKQALADQLAVAEIRESEPVNQVNTGNFVDLPLYPFEEKTFWVGPLPGNLLKNTGYQVVWKELDGAALQHENGQKAIVLLLNPSAASIRLTIQLPDTQFSQIITRYWIHQGQDAHIPAISDLEPFVSEIRIASPGQQLIIIYDTTSVEDKPVIAGYTQHFQSALSLLRECAGSGNLADSLVILTALACNTVPEMEHTNAVQYSLATLCLSAGLEMPQLPILHLDLEDAEGKNNIHMQSFSALLTQDYYRQIAVRKGAFWYNTLSPLPEPSATLYPAAGGNYLVTGGNGSLGRHVASWLLDNKAGRAILVSRKTPESRTNGDPRVEHYAMDISDERQVAEFERQLNARGIGLNGIVHAAGISHRAGIGDLNITDIHKAFASKVDGTHLLAKHLAHPGLEFFICYSSIASVWGSGLLAHYAAANAYMDAETANLRRAGIPAKVINWGPWAGSNMMQQDADSAALLEASGISPVSPDHVREQYPNLLQPSLHQEVYADLHPAVFVPIMEIRRPSAFWEEIRVSLAESNPVSGQGKMANQNLLTSQERTDYLCNILHTELRTVLGMARTETIPGRRSFSEMGMDSILLMKFVQRLNDQYGIPASTNMLFNYPTPDQLLKHLDIKMNPQPEVPEPENKRQPDAAEVISRNIGALDNNDLLELIQSDIQKYL